MRYSLHVILRLLVSSLIVGILGAFVWSGGYGATVRAAPVVASLPHTDASISFSPQPYTRASLTGTMSTTVPITATGVVSTTLASSPISATTNLTTARGTPLELQQLLQSLSLSEERMAAQRQAIFHLGQGDALQQSGDTEAARQKWEDAATAYRKAEDSLGESDAYLRLANSYMPPVLGCMMTALVQPYPGAGRECATRLTWREQRELANIDPDNFLRAARYYLEGMLAGADAYDQASSGQHSYDPAVIERAEAAYAHAITAFRADDCGTAMIQSDEALRLYRSQNHETGELRALTLQAVCRLSANQFVRAFALLFEALDIAQNLPLGTHTDTQYLEAGHLYEQGQYRDAEALYLEVLASYEAEDDAASVAQTHHELGNVYAQMGLYATAKEQFDAALAGFEKIENSYQAYNLAAVHHNLGNLAVLRGDYAAAYANLETALALWRATGDPAHEAASLNTLALALRGQSRFAQARQVLDEAQALAANLPPDPALRGDILNNIGYVYYSQGRYQDALDFFQQGLDERLKLNPPQRAQKEFESRSNLAAAHAGLRHFETALAIYEEVLTYAEQADSALAVAAIRVNMANIHIDRGDYQRGIAHLYDVLPIVEESGARPMLASTRANLGAVLLRTGQRIEGQDQMDTALAHFQTLGDRASEAALHNNMGLFLATVGHPISATHELTQALGYWEENGNSSAAASVLSNLALLSATQQNWGAAQEYAERTLNTSTQPAEQILAHTTFSAILLTRGHRDDAIEHAETAMSLAQRLGDARYVLVAHELLASIYVTESDWAQAERHVTQGLKLLEEMQGRISIAELKAAYLGQIAGIYDLAVRVALAQGQPELALRYAEQSRARALLEQLNQGRIDVRAGANAELIQREQDLRQQMLRLEQERRTVRDETAQEQLRMAVETAQREYAQLLVQLKATHPEYARLIGADVREWSQLLADVTQGATVPADSTLIVYYAFSQPFGDSAVAWVIEQGKMDVVWLDEGEEALRASAQYAWQSMAHKNSDVHGDVDTIRYGMGQLYQTMFAPLEPYIHNDTLIIVPHGPLHSLPFAALWDAQNERYLLDDYAISYAPSVSILPALMQKRNDYGGRALIVGNPDKSLPNAEAEARKIATLYSTAPVTSRTSTLLLGAQATEPQVRSDAQRVDVLHVATHGQYNPINPLFSRLELAATDAEDGYLEVHEIYDLDLTDANLVVLSACESTQGELTGGDEIVGLTRAFMYAGAPTVIATLWAVEDDATAALMETFYQRLLAGDATDEALRAAQRSVLAQEPWHSPYYWAAFGVYGLGTHGLSDE